MALSTKLHQWQSYLIDMSRRNKLLYFSLDRHPGIQFHVDAPAALYGRVTSGRKPITVSDLAQNLDPDDLSRKLMRLRTRAREALNDRGTNILFLTFGVLEWRETETSEEIIRSPLVLVPVHLRRDGISSPYQLQRLDNEDVTINPTLREKLHRDFGMELPEGINVQGEGAELAGTSTAAKAANALESTVEAIRRTLPREGRSWVISSQVYLSIFSFAKLVMYQDLTQHQELVLAHPVLRSIGGDTTRLHEPASVLPMEELDNRLVPHDVLQVLDADSSQQAAIHLAKQGGNFVLEGPPGTGKSQTIANIIAECLGEGKRVLFVSEKMAALEVVQQRLRAVGLDEFCLDLHSHKANKNAVLDELRLCLASAETPRRATTLATDWQRKSSALLLSRQELNAYVHELHKPRTRLQCSAFDIYGALAHLHEVPNLDCTLPAPTEVTPDRLAAMDRQLDDLLTRSDVLATQATHPWRETRVDRHSEELAANIQAHFGRAATLLNQMQDSTHGLDTALGGADLHNTMEYATRGLMLADIAVRSPLPESAWLRRGFTNEAMPAAEEAAQKSDTYYELSNRLDVLYQRATIELDPAPIHRALTEEVAPLMRRLRGNTDSMHDLILVHAESIESHLVRAAEITLEMASDAAEIAKLLDQDSPTTIQTISELNTLAAHVLNTPQPPERWLNRDTFAGVRVAVADAAERYGRTRRLRAELLGYYEPSLLSLDVSGLNARFTNQYNSWLRYVRPEYWRDVRQVRGCLRPGSMRTVSDIGVDVRKAYAMSVDERTLWDQRGSHAALLGTMFAAWGTDWNQVHHVVEWTMRLGKLLGGQRPSERVAALITGAPSKLHSLRTRLQRLQASLAQWQNQAAFLADLLHLDDLPNDAMVLDEVTIPNLQNWLLAVLESFRSYWQAAQALASLRSTASTLADRKWSSLLEDLRMIEQVRELRTWFLEREATFSVLFGTYFDGLNTKWNAIRQALAWCDELNEAWGSDNLPDRLVQIVSGAGQERPRLVLREVRDQVRQMMHELESEWAFYDSILPLELLPPEGMPIAGTEFSVLIDRIRGLVDELPQLEQWIDFRRYWKQCEGAGLGSFLEAVARQTPAPMDLVDLFHKRFYQVWLDAAVQTCPQLAHFRGITHQQLIERFRQLDEDHIKLAQTRLRASLAEGRAFAISGANTGYQLSGDKDAEARHNAVVGHHLDLLRHELGKKRHRSIRQLIRGAGSAVLALKPCWMMSPLSVSQYAEPGSVNFDVVVFDEASQICPEDAICSIMRGDQVIVVGDPKQLPPTRFFTKSVSDDDDVDTETEEEVFESILDECIPAMPSRSLLWHYRSQHEALIAFSNHHFYGSRLQTFPGPQTEHREGVSFEYVPDGRYDRSRTRTNRREAARVVELIFDHFDRHPNRSLGVVALSEAQQEAIQRELETQRLNRPDLGQFFDENRPDSFFVKNLESVQGDERDVIILSVGYGKDTATGRIHHQFGPINRAGGERRLNVAITRAKYQVVLVSSIQAEELDLSGSRSSGARLLRAYLEYAERGPGTLGIQDTTLATEATAPHFDSPFEEDVYNALAQRGMKLVTQVGCSGYRIDMAVRDPRWHERFILGIECDGATYHSSRTARDRDRLRQQRLEHMGWRIHRIWSRDWVRDRNHEIQKILDRLSEMSLAPAPPTSAPISAVNAAPAGLPPQRVRMQSDHPSGVPRIVKERGNFAEIRTCETCTQYQAQTVSSFRCLKDHTTKRRDPSGHTSACPTWKRASTRAVR